MEGLITALIGVGGTIIGTILGWCLNALSSKGKIVIYLSSWSEKFQCYKLGSCTNSSSKSETELYRYRCSIDVYNSSADTKILRDIRIVFTTGKKDLLSSIPYNEASKRMGMDHTVYDKFNPLNVPPKSVQKVELFSNISIKEGKFEEVWKVNKIYFEYKNEKNKTKRVLIQETSYNDYFEKSEDKNGQDEDAE